MALTAPNMLLGLSLASESDLLMAAPGFLVRKHAAQLGLVFCQPPIALERFEISAAASHAALADPGVVWLLDTLEAAHAN